MNEEYKDYSLRQLETWVYDCLSNDASPLEIYNTIINCIEDDLKVYKKSVKKCEELLSYLKNNNIDYVKLNSDDEVRFSVIKYDDMIASGYTMTADGFWIKEGTKSGTK